MTIIPGSRIETFLCIVFKLNLDTDNWRVKWLLHWTCWE